MVGDRDRAEAAVAGGLEQHLDRGRAVAASGRCACAGRPRSAAASRSACRTSGLPVGSWRRATRPAVDRLELVGDVAARPRTGPGPLRAISLAQVARRGSAARPGPRASAHPRPGRRARARRHRRRPAPRRARSAATTGTAPAAKAARIRLGAGCGPPEAAQTMSAPAIRSSALDVRRPQDPDPLAQLAVQPRRLDRGVLDPDRRPPRGGRGSFRSARRKIRSAPRSSRAQ